MNLFKKLIKQGRYDEAYPMMECSDISWVDAAAKGVHPRDLYMFAMYCFAKDKSVDSAILLCDILLYYNVDFSDTHTVIEFVMRTCLAYNGMQNKKLLQLIVSTYESHPDSPFTEEEIAIYKEQLNAM